MARPRLHPLSLAFPIVAVGLLDEGEADAAFTYGGPYCPQESTGYSPTTGGDYCDNYAFVQGLAPWSATAIPTDGVLVLQATLRGAITPTDALDLIDEVVLLADTPVPGALEITAVPSVLIWRPDAPLTPGATYRFTADLLDNGQPGGCSEPLVEIVFTADAAAAAALEPSVLTAEQQLELTFSTDLGDLACCPDVAPVLHADPCGGAPTLEFPPDRCASLQADGRLRLDLTATPAATGATAGQVYYSVAVDGVAESIGLDPPALELLVDKPVCAIVTATDLASGESLAGPMACFGGDVADQLGPHAVAPFTNVACSLRRCELSADGNTWDLDACTPLDPDHPLEPAQEPEPDKACDCTSAAPTDLAALALAGLLMARRRRPRPR